jgi:hypothetical protein
MSCKSFTIKHLFNAIPYRIEKKGRQGVNLPQTLIGSNVTTFFTIYIDIHPANYLFDPGNKEFTKTVFSQYLNNKAPMDLVKRFLKIKL